MKWVVIGNRFIEERYRFLNDQIKEFIPDAEVTFLEGNPENPIETLEQAKAEYSQIRLERPYRETIVDSLETMTSLTKTLRTADVFVKSEDQWWPRSTFYEAIVRVLALRLKNIDLTAGVFVVGTGASARAAVAAFIKLGYSDVIITDRLNEKGQALVADLRKTFLNVDIHFVPADALTQLPGDRQIIFNTTPFLKTNALLEELYYFNYMKSDGIVMDMTLQPVRPPLLNEAESVGALAIEGCELAAWSDVLWVQMCLGQMIDYPFYLSGLRNLLEELEKKNPSD